LREALAEKDELDMNLEVILLLRSIYNLFAHLNIILGPHSILLYIVISLLPCLQEALMKLDQTQKEQKNVEKEKKEFNRQIKQLQTTVKDLQSRQMGNVRQMDSLQKENRDLKQRFSDVEAECTDALESKSHLKTKLASVEAKLVSESKAKEEAELKRSRAEALLKTKGAEVDVFREKAIRLGMKVNQLEKDQRQKSMSGDDVASLKLKLSSTMAKLDESRIELHTLKGQREYDLEEREIGVVTHIDVKEEVPDETDFIGVEFIKDGKTPSSNMVDVTRQRQIVLNLDPTAEEELDVGEEQLNEEFGDPLRMSPPLAASDLFQKQDQLRPQLTVTKVRSGLMDVTGRVSEAGEQCGICQSYDPPLPPVGTSSYKTDWVGCDCGRWFHKQCTKLARFTERFSCRSVKMKCLKGKATPLKKQQPQKRSIVSNAIPKVASSLASSTFVKTQERLIPVMGPSKVIEVPNPSPARISVGAALGKTVEAPLVGIPLQPQSTSSEQTTEEYADLILS